MNKTDRIFARVTKSEKNEVEQAAKDHRSIAAFLIFATRKMKKNCRLIELVEKSGSPTDCIKLIRAAGLLAKQQNINISALKVVAK